jgi:hypothetical protein
MKWVICVPPDLAPLSRLLTNRCAVVAENQQKLAEINLDFLGETSSEAETTPL